MKEVIEKSTTVKCPKCDNDYLPRHTRDYMCSDCYSKQGRRSKRKGSAQELRYAKKLQEMFDKYDLDYRARRTPRSGAIHEFEPADIMFSRLPVDSVFNIHAELKNTASWSIEEWYEKANEIEKERGTNRPVVLIIRHPSSHQEFMVLDSEFGTKILIENELFRNEQKTK